MKNRFPFEVDASRILCENDFEDTLNGWEARGPEEDHFEYSKYRVRAELSDEEAHTGKQCLKVSGRTKHWNGATINITDYLLDGEREYEAAVWVKIPEGCTSCRVQLSLQAISVLMGTDFPHYTMWDDYSSNGYKLSKFRLPTSAANVAWIDQPGHWDLRYPKDRVTDDGWVLLHGRLTIDKNRYKSFHIYIETTESSAGDQDIYIDDFVLLIGE